MVRDPNWIVHRFGETLTVKVGSFLAPANYRLPAAMEEELRTWFRWRRWQGWAVAVPLVVAAKIAANRLEMDLLFTLAIMGVVFGWSVLSGNTPELFLRSFAKARPVGPTGQRVSPVSGGLVVDSNEDGTADVKALYGSGCGFRIPEDQSEKLRPWYRQSRRLAWAITIPGVGLLLLVNSGDRFSPGQKTWITALLWITVVVLLLSLSKWQFHRFFPEGKRIAGKQSFFAGQAELPMYRRALLIPMLIGALLLDALVIWGLWIKPEIAVGDIVFLAGALGASAYLLSIAVYQFKDRSRNRTGARD